MIDIRVLSRRAAEEMEAQQVPHLIVSINCPGEEPASIATNRATLGRVNLFFWDLDEHPDGMTQETCPLATLEDGRRVVELVRAHPDAERVVVHCTAGRSRSAAVAAALHKVLNGSDEAIFKDARYHPNMRVYRHVLEAWHEGRGGEA